MPISLQEYQKQTVVGAHMTADGLAVNLIMECQHEFIGQCPVQISRAIRIQDQNLGEADVSLSKFILRGMNSIRMAETQYLRYLK